MNLNYNYDQIVKCGHSDCIKKDTCVHFKEHKRTTDCQENCAISNGIYKCYTIPEQRKFKLEKLSNND